MIFTCPKDDPIVEVNHCHGTGTKGHPCTVWTAEYNDPHHRDPNIRGAGRIATATREEGGVRVKIVGEGKMVNDPMVVVSDALIPTALWEQYEPMILAGLPPGAKVTRKDKP